MGVRLHEGAIFEGGQKLLLRLANHAQPEVALPELRFPEPVLEPGGAGSHRGDLIIWSFFNIFPKKICLLTSFYS
jgi:hypothetical protein